MKTILWTILAIFLSSLNGCTNVPKADAKKSEYIKTLSKPSQGKSSLYILGGSAGHDLWLNGDCLGFAGKSGFFYTEIEAEKEHWISTDNLLFPDHIKLKAEVGKFYYIEQYAKFLSWNILLQGPVPSDLRHLNEQQGKKKISSKSLIEQNSCFRQALKLPQ